eukprot:CAMPEP_0198734398 /NCGR_PEP_ID=MMETSP1475-20131203/52233_1 /TAXON_ID= ORGANISM="Unidentified sp., Strain CCMP1999" /NCGR_SAMPLE_ID=MMETSP1475 /ASSEMBLY_ACC=CAM_ASM_001111 /LENGTH=350 /DNA_ID=CAMNT_0044497855 /DNA_START=132 /DNA_END=1181 /DNA_ORIENTATION=-
MPMELVAYGPADGWGDAKGLAILRPMEQRQRLSDRIVPIPLMNNVEVDLVRASIMDPGHKASVIDIAKILFQTRELCDGLHWPDDAKPNAIASLYAAAAMGKIENCLQVLEHMLDSSPCRVVDLALEEMESLSVDPVLCGCLKFRKRMATVFGRSLYKPEDELVVCRPGEAISLSLALNMQLRIPRWVWDSCSARLSANTATKSISFSEEMRFSDDGGVVERAEGRVPSDATKDEVFRMSVEELRSALRSVNVPSKTTSSRNELISRLLPWLDETVRRDILIDEAVRREDYQEAARLQGGQSERSRMKAELDRAIAEERYLDAKACKERLDRLTELRADPTQDEGSYDPY